MRHGKSALLAAIALALAGFAAPAAAAPTPYAVHLESYGSAAKAERAWGLLKRRFPDLLRHLEPRFPVVDIAGRGRFHRVAAGPLSLGAARRLCVRFRARHHDCAVIADPGGTAPTAEAPPAATVPTPARAAPTAAPTAAPNPVLAPPPRPAEPATALPSTTPAQPAFGASPEAIFGRWTRQGQDCARRSMTLSAQEVTFTRREGGRVSNDTMSCVVSAQAGAYTLRCADGSTAQFTPVAPGQLRLDWERPRPGLKPRPAGSLWIACPAR